MLESQFENIRPFFDHEAAEAATSLAKIIDLEGLLTPLVGRENAAELAKNILQVDSISDFQDDLTYPFLEALIESTTDGVTLGYSSGAFEKDLESPTLHLTNHRDIVLDPSLVNVARMGCGFPSTEIGIGDNLLSHKWLEDLVRLNRCFIVRRGGGPRERLESSLLVATYIRHVVKNGSSVWLAQKEGRAKDGRDSTSPALIRMLISEGGKDAWEMLNVKPVSISYEWDPCDYMKVRELLKKEHEGEYLKEPGEDERSMASGMTGWKGRIHLEFCTTIPWKEVEGERTERTIAELVDRAIYQGYKIFPNQVIAADRLGLDELAGFTSDIQVTDEDRAFFSNRIDKVVEEVGTNIASKEKIENTFCEIMVQPLLAKYKVSLESKSI
ncbi:MAG: hypothetical protein O2852_01170 [Bacteroidetes bacterium]|jgi:hypothetical protein|nr:hypothetical protein [Bacteroidota bacterium]MDA0979952.1 hypothetical protein [Bacteroidota bacterium]